MSPEERVAWREAAREYPSGRPCNGVHDATPDRRILALLDALDEGRDEAMERAERAEAELARLRDGIASLCIRGLNGDGRNDARDALIAVFDRVKDGPR